MDMGLIHRKPAPPEYQPPTMEDGMREVLRNVPRVVPQVSDYAPGVHPDRVSATSRIMCEAIEKVFVDTATGLDDRVADLKSKVSEIDAGVDAFKTAMRAAADGLVARVQEVMAQYEDISAKMQASPFNGSVPAFLTEQKTDG